MASEVLSKNKISPEELGKLLADATLGSPLRNERGDARIRIARLVGGEDLLDAEDRVVKLTR